MTLPDETSSRAIAEGNPSQDCGNRPAPEEPALQRASTHAAGRPNLSRYGSSRSPFGDAIPQVDRPAGRSCAEAIRQWPGSAQRRHGPVITFGLRSRYVLKTARTAFDDFIEEPGGFAIRCVTSPPTHHPSSRPARWQTDKGSAGGAQAAFGPASRRRWPRGVAPLRKSWQ